MEAIPSQRLASVSLRAAVSSSCSQQGRYEFVGPKAASGLSTRIFSTACVTKHLPSVLAVIVNSKYMREFDHDTLLTIKAKNRARKETDLFQPVAIGRAPRAEDQGVLAE